jgi:hypothetical protein
MSRERMRAEAEAREARTVTVRLVQRDLQRVHTNTRKHGRRHTRAHIHAHADGCGGRARRRSLRAARRCSAAADGVQRTWPRGPSGSAATTSRRGSPPRCVRVHACFCAFLCARACTNACGPNSARCGEGSRSRAGCSTAQHVATRCNSARWQEEELRQCTFKPGALRLLDPAAGPTLNPKALRPEP